MTNSTPKARGKLRTLLMILAITAGFIIYAYGWAVTDINLARPQEPQRQTNVQNALRELLSPNIFTQTYEIARTGATFQMGCPDGEAASLADGQAGDGPYIVVEPACGTRGDVVTVRGYDFAPNSLAQVRWTPPTGESRPRPILGTNRQTFDTGSGAFEIRIEVPSIRGAGDETHRIEVDARYPVGLPTLSNTTYEVINKMIETIFLALVATTLSILPSVILSFLAAGNLMKPIHTTLGNLMIGFAMLPLGAWLGSLLLAPIGVFAVNLGKGAYFGAGGLAASAVFIFASVTASQKLKRFDADVNTSRLRVVVNGVVLAVAVTFVVGLLGGLGVLFGSLFRTGIPGYASNFIGTLGELVELLIVPIAAVIGAFSLSSIGDTLTKDVIKQLDRATSYVVGGILGALCGAILMAATATIAREGALLGLLNPLVAGVLGAQILPLLYNRFVARERVASPLPPTAVDRSARLVLSLLAGVLIFVVTFNSLDIGRALVEGVLPRADTTALFGLDINTYVLRAMTIGLVLGGLTGAMTGTRAAFPIGSIIYNTTRTILNALRSIEPLIMGLVFVIWVGIGPFAGVLALTLHSIASLGKLYSEQVESIDSGPIEALESTGANRLQTVVYGVVPQIVPPYIAFTMYRWDINVRMSTIIGFVGGGGIGFLLQQQLNLLRYRDAGVAVLAIAIVVSALDYASASIRERYV